MFIIFLLIKIFFIQKAPRFFEPASHAEVAFVLRLTRLAAIAKLRAEHFRALFAIYALEFLQLLFAELFRHLFHGLAVEALLRRQHQAADFFFELAEVRSAQLCLLFQRLQLPQVRAAAALVRQRGSRANLRELETLEKQAELGRTSLGELKKEVCRLMLTAEKSFDGETVEKMTEKLGEEELKELKRVYGEKSAKMLGTQLCYGGEAREADDESDFRI